MLLCAVSQGLGISCVFRQSSMTPSEKKLIQKLLIGKPVQGRHCAFKLWNRIRNILHVMLRDFYIHILPCCRNNITPRGLLFLSGRNHSEDQRRDLLGKG